MKKFIVAITAILMLMTAQAATVKISATPFWTVADNGEFAANVLSGPEFESFYSSLAVTTDGFSTFCLERDTQIGLPSTHLFDVTPGASTGGFAGGSPDIVSLGTEALYTRFATGTLAGYDYSDPTARVLHAGLMQQAIWVLEDELSSLVYPDAGGGANPFLESVIAEFGTLTGAKADGSASSVFALNLGPKAQDFLVYRPSTPIPEGNQNFMLLGIGLATVVACRRFMA